MEEIKSYYMGKSFELLEYEKENARWERSYNPISDYDTFNVDLIGNALAELITVVSGREFIYRRVINMCSKIYMGQIVYIVVSREKYKERYYSNTTTDLVKELVKDGDAISMPVPEDKEWCETKKVTVFPCPNIHPDLGIIWDDGIIFNVEKFSYVKEFIEELVKYLHLNKIKSYAKYRVGKAINTCLTEFLKKYKEEHTSLVPPKINEKKIQVGE